MRLAYQIAICFSLLAPIGTCLAQTSQGPKVASREEYRWCLDEADQMKPLERELKARGRDQDASIKALQDEMNAHVAQQGKIDTTDNDAVDAFNKKLSALNERGDAYNKQAEDFNQRMAAFNARVMSVNKRCAGLVVSIKDKDAVQKERAAKTTK